MLSIPGMWALKKKIHKKIKKLKKKIHIYKAGRASLGKLMELAHLVSPTASFAQAPMSIPSST